MTENPAGTQSGAAKPRSKPAKPRAEVKSAQSSTVASGKAARAKPVKAAAAKAAPAKAARAKSAPPKPHQASAAAPTKTKQAKRGGLAAAAASLLDPMAPVRAYANLAGKMLNRMVSEQKTEPAELIKQIRKGPQGPRVVAAFDFDGTLIGGYSGGMLFQERRKRKEVTRDEITESIGITFKTMAKLVEANEMVARAFARWEGKSQEEMRELSEHVYENAIQDSIYPEMREILEAHRKAGHTIVVATSASRYQAEPAVKALGVEHLLCTELEVKQGKLTGKLAGENLFGSGKAAAVARFVEERGGKLADTHFYADGSEEVGLMKQVGHPRPVNPGSKLLEAAKNHKWPVLRLGSRGGTKPAHLLRGLAGMASIVPILQTSIPVGVLSRDKKTFANTVIPAWIAANMKLAGVSLKVSGRNNLRSRRPAVFIFNHRNYWDGMIAAALVKTDFAGIARKEMGDNAVGKLVTKLMPTVLIDRGTGSKANAVNSLQPVVDAMRNEGYSVMLSPEGTRVKGNLNSVGPFKKGAFHMAMAAGVPVVPIVIRNALDIASHSGTMRPGVVDVAVLPPIPTDDWTQENMGEKIEGVRQQFITTLTNFPAPDKGE